jgi:hypothetical protein
MVLTRQTDLGKRPEPWDDSNDEIPRRFELRVDGSWQPAVLEMERHAETRSADDPAWQWDAGRDALLNLDEFNIRQVEAACGREDLELRDDRGGFWTFTPRRIKFESDAFAEGELRPANRPSRTT